MDDRLPAIEVRDVSFSYTGRPVLSEVGFSIAAGEFAVLLGPNGAGKTTLFSLITRLYDTRAGAIGIAGFDLRRHSAEALSRLGVVFQQPTLDLELTVRQNLHYYAALHGMARSLARRRMEEQLARLDMLEHAGERVRHLSGGQRRRVEIARALLHAPPLLLLDEPTVGLDVASRRGLVAHVHRLCAEEGVAVLWATHLIDEVHDGDTVIVLDRGRIRAHGPVARIVSEAGAATLGEAFDVLTESGKA